jgi:FkbM family methyltransferase
MIKKTIKTRTGTELTIENNDAVVANWFANEGNQSDYLIQQINDGIHDRFVPKTDHAVIIDCGANIGAFSIYAQDRAKQIIAIEPDPRNQYIFQQLTSQFNNIVLDNSALSNRDGTLKLNIHVAPTCNSIIYETDTDLSIDVPTKTIASILNEYSLESVDFVKCDIEGAEVLAITDATIDPVQNKIKGWVIEVHQTDRNTSAWPGNLENNRQQIGAVLKNAGYAVEYVVHDQIYAWK